MLAACYGGLRISYLPRRFLPSLKGGGGSHRLNLLVWWWRMLKKTASEGLPTNSQLKHPHMFKPFLLKNLVVPGMVGANVGKWGSQQRVRMGSKLVVSRHPRVGGFARGRRSLTTRGTDIEMRLARLLRQMIKVQVTQNRLSSGPRSPFI